MRLLCVCIVILFCVASPYSQTVNLTGTVTDSASNSPLSGVIVRLATLGYKDTTGSDGKYSLMSPPVSIIAGKSIGMKGVHPTISGGFLFFNLPQKGKVTAAIYSPTGRAIGTIIDQELAPGNYRAALPSIQKSVGIYYIKVISGNSQEIVKFLSVNEQQGQSRSVNQSRRLNKKLVTVVDTLLLEKTGYASKNVPITSYEGTLNITMTIAVPSVPVISGAVAGDGSAMVSWGAVTGATSYNLYYKAGTTVDMTSGTKLTGVTSPRQVTGLINGTQYAFAVSSVNDSGESGLSSVVMATPNIVDIDGNIYHTVTIGTQIWMVENLKTTRYNDGSPIPLVTDSAAWANLTTPGYCWFNDSVAYGSIYGALYNWYAVNTGKLAPTGWHVPSDSEWTVLIVYLGDTLVAGGLLKDTTNWSPPNTGATNSTGFSALPGGFRIFDDGTFHNIGYNGYWWSSSPSDSTNSIYFGLSDYYANVFPISSYKVYGFSVRCVKDN